MKKENNSTDLKKTLIDIEKTYGKNIFVNKTKKNQNIFSSGSLIIDRLTGINGYPINGMIEIFGQPSTGKTTLALHAAKSFQKNNQKRVIFIDLERTLNLNYAENIGVNLEKLIVLRPNDAEATFDLIIDLLKTNEVCLIIVDSVAALLPQTEKQSKMSDNTIGLQARIMSKALRKINYLLTESQATIIFINQIREKIKIFFGNPEITSGGNALKFYASLRLELRRKTKILDNKQDNIGINVNVNILKNKLAKPFQKGMISIFFNKGLIKNQEILNLALEKNIIKMNGPWYYFEKTKLGLGANETMKCLETNPEIIKKIIALI